MEFKKHNTKIIILSGKAKSGKNEAAELFCQELQNKKCIQISYGAYLKNYTRHILNWDDTKEEKPREFLQQLGVELIKKQIDPHMLVRRICEDIMIYSYFYDVIIITDARFIEEIEMIKDQFSNVSVVRIHRDNFDNGLKSYEKEHISETALDHYQNYDYWISNDGNKENLRKQVHNIIEEEKI